MKNKFKFGDIVMVKNDPFMWHYMIISMRYDHFQQSFVYNGSLLEKELVKVKSKESE